ncbi:hypothetical protein K1719_020817 [Acacia pycnantha]|nr:hypothetical protein K1719_020817 [Acacia pycnantha]
MSGKCNKDLRIVHSHIKAHLITGFDRRKTTTADLNHRDGKQPVTMKAVVYALSPFQQKVMTGLWKDVPSKIHHKISENWISTTLLLAPLIGVHTYVKNNQEKEKLSHRY